jgi:hypothetical protein
MFVTPLALKTAAAVRITKKPTTFETAIPNQVSTLIRSSSALAVRRGACFRGGNLGSSFCSSTSSAACQKNRYGLIVVPKIATIAVIAAVDHSNDGTRVASSTRRHGNVTTKTTPTYASSDTHSHFRYGTYRRYGMKT